MFNDINGSCLYFYDSTSHEKFDRGPAMACRLYGSLELNKVAGNFHITAGKTLPLPRGHAHVGKSKVDGL